MQGYTPQHKASQDSQLSCFKWINSIRLNVPLLPPKGYRAIESLKVLKNIMFYAEQL